MRKITNSQESNEYYEIVNKHIDEYINDHKVRPSNLKSYFRSAAKMESFLKKAKLDDVDGIKRVVNDVIDDRYAGEKDGVLKFESFILEDFGKIQVDKSDVSYEKILADLYNSSVGHVEVTDDAQHKYTISDFGEKIQVIIYSQEDLNKFKESLIDSIVESAKKHTFRMNQVDIGLPHGDYLPMTIEFGIESIVDESKLKEEVSKKAGQKSVITTITFLSNTLAIRRTGQYSYSKEFKGYHVWEFKSKQ